MKNNNYFPFNKLAAARLFVIIGGLFLFNLSAFSQNERTKVTTVVDSETDEPLFSATVVNQREITLSNFTDGNGKVEIIGNPNDTIEFSYLGYETRKFRFADIPTKIELKSTSYGLDLVVVISVNKFAERLQDVPAPVEVITAKDIKFKDPQSSAGMLENLGSVYVQRSQAGGGSPVVRGFEANKVLLVIDGVRMNNAIYRSGHLQNVITIDNSMLERSEVVFGPAAVMYGSDALGGVMSFYTKEIKLQDVGKFGPVKERNANFRVSTANFEKKFHYDHMVGKKKWGSLTSISVADYGDTRSGANGDPDYPGFGDRISYTERIDGKDSIIINPNPRIQVQTGYSQVDLLQKFKFQPSDSFKFHINLQYSHSTDIPRYDALTENTGTDTLADGTMYEIPRYAEWNYGPQKRLFSSLRAEIIRNANPFFHRASITAAFQKIDEDRITRIFEKDVRHVQQENVNVYSINADFSKRFDGTDKRLLYGAEFVYNTVNSEAGRFDADSSTYLGVDRTRYPNGGSRMTNVAGYMNYRYKIKKNINFIFGARYTFTSLFAEFLGNADNLPFETIESAEPEATGSIALAWETPTKWNIGSVISTAFRAPNVDDVGKIRVNNDFVLIPTDDLDPERTVNFELSIYKFLSKKRPSFSEKKDTPLSKTKVGATAYYSYLTKVIVRGASELNGDSLLAINGVDLRIQTNQNVGRGYIYGWNAYLYYDFDDKWQFKTTLTYTKGLNLTDNVPLGHIPPIYGMTSLSFQAPSQAFRIEFAARYNGSKRLNEYAPGGVDNQEYATENGTPAWVVYNVYSSVRLNKNWDLNLSCENIFDTHYRPFASGVSSPGINFIASLRYNFTR